MLNYPLMKSWENWFIIPLMVIIPLVLVHFFIARKAIPNGE